MDEATANVDPENEKELTEAIPFYEKCGFKRHHSIKNFFLDNYDHTIIEEGIRLTDMVILRKEISVVEK